MTLITNKPIALVHVGKVLDFDKTLDKLEEAGYLTIKVDSGESPITIVPSNFEALYEILEPRIKETVLMYVKKAFKSIVLFP